MTFSGDFRCPSHRIPSFRSFPSSIKWYVLIRVIADALTAWQDLSLFISSFSLQSPLSCWTQYLTKVHVFAHRLLFVYLQLVNSAICDMFALLEEMLILTPWERAHEPWRVADLQYMFSLERSTGIWFLRREHILYWSSALRHPLVAICWIVLMIKACMHAC